MAGKRRGSEPGDGRPGDEDALLGPDEAAARAGVARGTWSAYVARGHAPEPDERDRRTGSPRWRQSTVDAWKSSRPGRGAGGGRPRKPAGDEETGAAS